MKKILNLAMILELIVVIIVGLEIIFQNQLIAIYDANDYYYISRYAGNTKLVIPTAKVINVAIDFVAILVGFLLLKKGIKEENGKRYEIATFITIIAIKCICALGSLTVTSVLNNLYRSSPYMLTSRAEKAYILSGMSGGWIQSLPISLIAIYMIFFVAGISIGRKGTGKEIQEAKISNVIVKIFAVIAFLVTVGTAIYVPVSNSNNENDYIRNTYYTVEFENETEIE